MKTLKLFVLAMPVAALLLILAVCWLALSGGDQLRQKAGMVILGKEVTADSQAPSLCLIEARLTLSRALEGTLTPVQANRQFDKLAEDYAARANHWNLNPPAGLVRELLAVQHAAALKFLAIGHNQMLEPLLRGDMPSARAALPAVEFAYEAHRRSVDATAVASHAFVDYSLASLETAMDRIARWTVVSLSAAMLLMAAFIAALRWLPRKARPDRPAQPGQAPNLLIPASRAP